MYGSAQRRVAIKEDTLEKKIKVEGIKGNGRQEGTT